MVQEVEYPGTLRFGFGMRCLSTVVGMSDTAAPSATQDLASDNVRATGPGGAPHDRVAVSEAAIVHRRAQWQPPIRLWQGPWLG